jgi:hypothetical protein
VIDARFLCEPDDGIPRRGMIRVFPLELTGDSQRVRFFGIRFEKFGQEIGLCLGWHPPAALESAKQRKIQPGGFCDVTLQHSFRFAEDMEPLGETRNRGEGRN